MGTKFGTNASTVQIRFLIFQKCISQIVQDVFSSQILSFVFLYFLGPTFRWGEVNSAKICLPQSYKATKLAHFPSFHELVWGQVDVLLSAIMKGLFEANTFSCEVNWGKHLSQKPKCWVTKNAAHVSSLTPDTQNFLVGSITFVASEILLWGFFSVWLLDNKNKNARFWTKKLQPVNKRPRNA